MKVFYKLSIIFIISTFLIGCSQNAGSKNNSTDTKIINQLKAENERLNTQVQDLTRQIENDKKNLNLRNQLDTMFFTLLYAIDYSQTNTIKSMITSNITIENGKLISKIGNETYIFNPNDTYKFRERYFNLENENTYKSIYEIWSSQNEQIYECYVNYVFEQNSWKINSIQIDGL